MRVDPEQISNLRKARQARGLTQERMAARLRVSLGWYALLEREPSFLSERIAKRAASLLGCRPEELLP